jgi:Uma2 family endonuclease
MANTVDREWIAALRDDIRNAGSERRVYVERPHSQLFEGFAVTLAAQTSSDFDQLVRLNVSWAVYDSLVQELSDHRNARLTYDGETLEIMSPGFKHELVANLLAALIDLASVEWSVSLTNFGSATFKTQTRGFEADKTYYVDAHRRIRDVENIVLPIDPPPDLVVKVDIASSSSKRLDTYAALGVLEIWHFKSEHFTFLALREGEYVPSDVSHIIRGLPAAEVARRIQSGIEAKGDSLDLRVQWQRWLRDNRHLRDNA